MKCRSITLTPGQVTTVLHALTICDCGDADDCLLCETRREAVGILAKAKVNVSPPLADNEGLVVEDEPKKVWDRIEEALLAHD